jgi:hypothetical protein
VPLRADVTAINGHITSAGYVGAIPTELERRMSAYLRAHQRGARYEVAAESATSVGSLIVRDARPVVMLTSYGGRTLTTIAQLQHLVATGQVRYAFLSSLCGRHPNPASPACSPPARWVREHGTDVSAQAGLSRDRVLWRLPGAPACASPATSSASMRSRRRRGPPAGSPSTPSSWARVATARCCA